MKNSKKAKNVKEYIEQQSNLVRPLLKKMQQIIKSAAPKSQEVIWYSMPTYRPEGQKSGYPLVCFAAFEHHIGFYPMSAAIRKFKGEIIKGKFESAKGSVQFPIDRALPESLIKKIVKFNVAEANAKMRIKAAKSKTMDKKVEKKKVQKKKN